MNDLKEKIKAEAKYLGFSFTCFTIPRQTPHYPQYLEWIDADFAGEMKFLTRSQSIASRENPASLLTDSKSMIVLGFPYRPVSGSAAEYKGYGQIASYALYPDYHKVLKQKTRELTDRIDQICAHPNHYRFFIDSSFIMEKDSAYVAGAGWIGRNSLLITPSQGSYQFIACILTDLEMPPDAPFSTDLCKGCHKCLDACPTGCITDSHSIKADQCIAYLTIEYKGVIPRQLRSKIGNQIFGCEVCQSVCPHNQHIPTDTPGILSPLLEPQVDLLREIGISAREYSEKYAHTPILRASWESYRRNIIIAMGNSGSYEYLPVLEKILVYDPSWLLRLHAAWAIGKIGGKSSTAILKNALDLESDPQVKEEIYFSINIS